MAGYDIIGDVAVLEDESTPVEEILRTHKRVKTVCIKQSERRGKYRLRKLKVIHGENTETTHIEYGCRLFMDVKKAYFSPRESTERQRIAGQVKPGETVFVMFAGIGPYSIAIARKQKKCRVISMEQNPWAVRYMRRNVEMNRTGNVEPVLGDVRKKAPAYYGKCDRVVMPLPQEGHAYLPEAIRCLKNRGIIHFYYISQENSLYSEAEMHVRKAAARLKRKYMITGRRKVLPYGPRIWKVCLDARVSE